MGDSSNKGRQNRAGRTRLRIVPAVGDASQQPVGDVPGESASVPATRKLQHTLPRVDPREAITKAPSQVCPLCKGAQWLRSDDLPPWDPQYKGVVECECLLEKRREKRKQQLRELSGLPAEDELIPTLQTFRPRVRGVQEAYRVTREFIDALGKIAEVSDEKQRRAFLIRLMWVVLRGPVGVGKTHLAMALVGSSLELGIETFFATAPDLLDHLKAAFDPASEISYDELFERMKKAELLVLDDLGAQHNSAWAKEKLFQLIDYRYRFHLPTFITLNERAWDKVDERLQSRMSDVALVQLVVMRDAQDYRTRQREEAISPGEDPDSKEE